MLSHMLCLKHPSPGAPSASCTYVSRTREGASNKINKFEGTNVRVRDPRRFIARVPPHMVVRVRRWGALMSGLQIK
jgi:hypothetical protein